MLEDQSKPTGIGEDLAEERHAVVVMQERSRKVWETIPYFKKFSPAGQEFAVSALTTLGIWTVAKCDKRWNSKRWLAVWEELGEEQPQFIEAAISGTTEKSLTTAYMKLFQILEVGANSPAELADKRRASGQRQASVGGKLFLTDRSPRNQASSRKR